MRLILNNSIKRIKRVLYQAVLSRRYKKRRNENKPMRNTLIPVYTLLFILTILLTLITACSRSGMNDNSGYNNSESGPNSTEKSTLNESLEERNVAACPAGSISTEKSCCPDPNGDRECDTKQRTLTEKKRVTTNERTPTQLPPKEPEKAHLYTRAEKEALAQEFTQRIVDVWDAAKWGSVYALLTTDDQKRLTAKQVATMLDIVSPERQLEYGEKYSHLLESFKFNAYEGLRLHAIAITMKEETAIFSVNATFHNVPIKHDPFIITWEGSEWRLQLESILPTADIDALCEQTGYEAECQYLYATAMGELKRCTKTEAHVVDCFTHFKRPVSKTAALEACAIPLLLSDQDECLYSVVRATGDESLCNHIQIATNQLFCEGIIAGQAEDLNSCLAKVESDSPSRDFEEAQCINGYIYQTADGTKCKLIPQWRELLRKECTELAKARRQERKE